MRSVWDCSEKELICAAAEGRISDVKAILRRVQNPNVWDEHGESPLGCAVRGGHTEVVRLLLNARARTERKATKQVPMLHVACERGDLEIVCMLLAYRADKNSKDRLGTTAAKLTFRIWCSKIKGAFLGRSLCFGVHTGSSYLCKLPYHTVGLFGLKWPLDANM